jgi:hypothetical protein
MSVNFILSLPREVRDQIYIYALSSPTGYLCTSIRTKDLKHFALMPFEPPHCVHFERIQLSLLQTCKQIYQEAKGIVYERNIWAVLNICQLLWQFRELDAGLSHRVRNIWLGVDLAHRGSLKDTVRVLEVLSGWAQQAGNLQNVTLNVISKKDDMHELMDLRLFGEPVTTPNGELNPSIGKNLFQEYITVLRDSWGKYDEQWAGVNRKLELRVSHLNDCSIGQPRETVKEMHDAFRGELWIDGRLCYKDGIEILQPFNRDFRGEWQVAWFREEDDWFWGR